MIETNREYRLGSRALFYSLAGSSSAALTVLVAALLAAAFRDSISSLIGVNAAGATVLLLFAITVAILFVSSLVTWLKYHFYTFALEEFDFKVRRGVLSREQVAIPYRQIQDVNIERPLIYRFFGVSRVIISSAGKEDEEGEENEGILDPVNKELADEIQTLLERRIGVQLVERERKAQS